MITARSGRICRKRCNVSDPLSAGKERSMSTSSGFTTRKMRSASSPDSAVVTSKFRRPKCVTNERENAESPSTIKMRTR